MWCWVQFPLNESGGYQVYCPDFDRYIRGDSLPDARYIAEDLMAGMLWNHLDAFIPQETRPPGEGWERLHLAHRISLAHSFLRARHQRGLGAEQVAHAVGIQESSDLRMEDPWKCNPTLGLLERVARVLGLGIRMTVEKSA